MVRLPTSLMVSAMALPGVPSRSLAVFVRTWFLGKDCSGSKGRNSIWHVDWSHKYNCPFLRLTKSRYQAEQLLGLLWLRRRCSCSTTWLTSHPQSYLNARSQVPFTSDKSILLERVIHELPKALDFIKDFVRAIRILFHFTRPHRTLRVRFSY